MNSKYLQTLELPKILERLAEHTSFSAGRELALSLQEVKKAGLTFAPETASEKLRGFVNKNISELRILESVRNALDAGWNGVKLYFMVGLPGETDADVDGIGRFATEIGRLCKGRPVRFNLSPFVPKPHTPLQTWPKRRRRLTGCGLQ